MELKKRISPKYIFIGLYFVAFLAFLIYGLQPAGAVQSEQISGKLEVPSIGLVSDVTNLELEDRKLNTPDNIVGSFSNHKNKTLLIGHSTTVFEGLKNVKLGDGLVYNDSSYNVIDVETIEKDQIKMSELLKSEENDTLVLMTCVGTLLGDGDSTHRLIITAIRD